MKRFSKISIDDIKTIQVDSGVLLKEFDVENPIFLPENVICATSGGINPVCAPEYYDFSEDVDNAKPSKETKRIRGWNATISFTTLTTSLSMIKLALGAADISGKVLSLRQRLQYAKDFKDIWWVGKKADDKLIAIRLIRSLSDSGFSLQTNKRGKGQIGVTLKGHSSFAEKDKIPMEIYVFAESDIPIVPDEPETPTASLYLYGTPSASGNIGLRSGDSVTYYDGVVASELPERDESDLPYAYIMKTIWSEYVLCFCPQQSEINDVGSLMMGFEHTRFNLEWRGNELSDEWGEPYTSQMSLAGELSWVNEDAYLEDGTVYLAKTDPIPVGEIVDTINDIPIYEDLR